MPVLKNGIYSIDIGGDRDEERRVTSMSDRECGGPKANSELMNETQEKVSSGVA